MNSLIANFKVVFMAISPILLDIVNPRLDSIIIIKEELLIVLIVMAILFQSVSLYKGMFNKNDKNPPSNPSAGDLI